MKMLERMWVGCGHCHGESACPMLAEARQTYEAHTWFQGRTLVLAALIIFVLPLALALLGGWLASSSSPLDSDETSTAQVVGVFAGLLGGVGLAPVLLRACRIRKPVALPTQQPVSIPQPVSLSSHASSETSCSPQ